MKKKILLMLCLCLGGSVVAAQGSENQDKEKDHKSRTAELIKKLANSYHQLNHSKSVNSSFLERVEIQSWDNSDFIPLYRFDYGYQNGERVEATTSFNFPNTAGWEPESRQLYSYDNGLLTSSIEQEYSNEEFLHENRSVYTYQQVGGTFIIHTDTYQLWDSTEEEWINESRASFVNDDGEIVRIDEEYWDGEDWIYSDRTLILHDNDDLIFQYQEISDDEEWENLYRDIYHDMSFTELYNTIIEEFVDRVEIGSSLAIFTSFPDLTEQDWDGEEWVDDYRQVTEVTTDDGTGEVTHSTISEQEMDGGEWVTISEVRIQYEGGLPVIYDLYEPDFTGDNIELVATIREEHNYNDQDLLTEILLMEYVPSTDDASQLEESVTGRVVLSYSDVSTSIETGTQPVAFSLGDAYPNPFNPATIIPFQAASPGHVSIRVYDMLGRYVATLADGDFSTGNHQVQFDASGLSSGIYMIRMQAPGMQQVRRVTLVK